jgi:spore coat protein CotF
MNQQQSNQNMIHNPQSPLLPQVKGPELNDRDRINDILANEKYLSSNIAIAAWEASHQQLHDDLMTILNETETQHRHLFNLMFQKGWYKLEAAEQQQIDQAHQQFSQYFSQIPYLQNGAKVQ